MADIFGGVATPPGNLMLFAQNLMEKGVVTVTSEASGKPKTRLFDRDRGPQWAAVDNAVQDIDLDLEVFPRAFSHVALVNIGITSGIEIYRGATFPPSTLAFSATTLMGGDPYIPSLGGLFNDRYVRVRILGGGGIPALGELFVGVPRLVARPTARLSAEAIVGNVVRDRTPGGQTWAAKLGPSRTRLDYAWAALELATDRVELRAAYAECDEGAKKLVVRDPFGIPFWMEMKIGRAHV